MNYRRGFLQFQRGILKLLYFQTIILRTGLLDPVGVVVLTQSGFEIVGSSFERPSGNAVSGFAIVRQSELA
jgi:hypothetical protein